MLYRRLGRSGVRVSALSFGSWVSFGKQLNLDSALKCLTTAREYGVNFFDNAEVYAHGASEEIMGAAIRKLGWPRLSYLISTKFFWGITEDINGKNTLNRKYLLQAMEGSLRRLQLDFVDLVYCHRPDPETPMEEVVWAMHNIIEKGQALYWGTSEWSAREVLTAYEIAEKNRLHKPVVEQPQYNLLHKERVEVELSPLTSSLGLGLTTWSPLASGILTGKYLTGIPSDSRVALPSMSWLSETATDPVIRAKVTQLVGLAKEWNTTAAALAIAWCAREPKVSTVILGASRPEQIHQNMEALPLLEKLREKDWAQVSSIFA